MKRTLSVRQGPEHQTIANLDRASDRDVVGSENLVCISDALRFLLR